MDPTYDILLSQLYCVWINCDVIFPHLFPCSKTEMTKLKSSAWVNYKFNPDIQKNWHSRLQHITYNEWLPLVLGKKVMAQHNMLPVTVGYSDRWNIQIRYEMRHSYSWVNKKHNNLKTLGRAPISIIYYTRAGFRIKGSPRTNMLPLDS